jgi:CheY-like chemotaxis protein
MPEVLVIDDDPWVRATLTQILELEGYGVVAVGDGRAALAYLSASSRPDLILLDLSMPGMSGWDFREEQRLHPQLASIPTVIISGEGNGQASAEALGASGFLRKPFSVVDLLETVQRHC